MSLLYKKCEVCGTDINKLQGLLDIFTPNFKIGGKLVCPSCGTEYSTTKRIALIGSLYSSFWIWVLPIFLLMSVIYNFVVSDVRLTVLFTLILYTIIVYVVMLFLPLTRVEVQGEEPVKQKNPYLIIFLKHHMSFIITPFVIIFGVLWYDHIMGITLLDENLPSETLGPIPTQPDLDQAWSYQSDAFLLFLLFNFITIGIAYAINQKPLAFARFIRTMILILLFVGIHKYYLPDFTQRLENYHKEKQYYLRQISLPRSYYTHFQNRKGKLLVFSDPVMRTTSITCSIVYDESDTLFDPKDGHRDLAYIREYNATISTMTRIGEIPIKITKIEPQFYYVCRDFDHKMIYANLQSFEATNQETIMSVFSSKETIISSIAHSIYSCLLMVSGTPVLYSCFPLLIP